MLVIKLKDNDYQGKSYKIFRNKELVPNYSALDDVEKKLVCKALDSFNNVSLNELEARGAILFPSKPIEKELNDKDKTVLSVHNLETDMPIIKTSNIMGFFSHKNGVQFEISSRFDEGGQQFFLHYMLQKVCNVAPSIDLTKADSNSFYEFLVYLFPTFLKRALVQGLFRTYVKRNYNDSNIRGVIDFPRHFRYNIPFNGKIAYSTREYSQDNYVTQLIRHTIEYIAENQNLKSILSCNEEMKDSVKVVRGCTGRYTRDSRIFIVNKNLKMLSHPYYTDYEPLRKMCIMILTHDKISYSTSSDKLVNGILFDGASLWEEYLNKIFEYYKGQLGVKVEHPNNRVGTGKKYLFDPPRGLIYPDFIMRAKEKQHTVSICDAKYKPFDRRNVDNSDYFQILSYMYRFSCGSGILLYPCNNSDSPEEHLYLAEHGKTISLSVLGFELPVYDNDTTYQYYRDFMEDAESKFIGSVKKAISKS